MPHETRTTCPYCGVGCGVIAKVDEHGIVSVKGDPDHPANLGRLCSKGSALADTLSMDGRALFPEIRGERADWNDALDLVAQKFSEAIAEHGPDSVAFYVSGQCLTEDYYVANKLMKGFIGSANIDTNSRLCMASSVAGHRRAFGSDTVPGTYEDLELADLIILVGSNLAWCHPVLNQRIQAAKQSRPGMKIVTIDPRRSVSADLADMHLMIRSDGDVALFNGLLAHLASSSAFDHDYVAAHTTGFPDALEVAKSRTILDISQETGLTVVELRAFYRLFETTGKVVTCYSQGVNQSSIGTDKVNAILNCHLATGRIGKPGMGPFSLTGQPNAMGGREVGGLANMLAAHMNIESEADRERVQRFWNAPTIAQKPGLKAVDMFEAVADGRIKALWIMATNPVVSMPDADRVREAIRNCPFVVVSDIQKNTDTAALAHVLLPATGWGEKDGTVTNSERRISRQRGFLDLPGETRPDWWHMAEVAKRMGFAGFDYAGPAEIFAEHAALSAFENGGSRDFDIGARANMGADEFDAMMPFQWPQPRGMAASTTRFFAKGGFYTPDRRARFIAVKSGRDDRTGSDAPFILNTGRIRDQWHTMTRTGKAARLSSHLAEPFVEINPADALELGISKAGLVQLENGFGSVVLRALLTERQPRGSVFVPMHWTDEYAADARIGALLAPRTDPVSGQPALKHAGVRVRPAEMTAFGFAVVAFRPGRFDAPYWGMAKAEGGWRVEFGFDAMPDDMEAWCRDSFGLSDRMEHLAYADSTTGQQRHGFFEDDRLVLAFYAAPEPVAVSRDWAVKQLSTSLATARARFAILAGRPGAGQMDPGATVCSCFSVGVNQIVAAVADGCRTVEAIGNALSAGTNCGSCRVEIKGIIDGCRRQAAE
ncbi:molybdopterin-dependent oxidoreductase [Rhizobium sp. KVB221]|uniref:Molybdopterin-dependent oxidoreductase n=1 Tax=Rhizobium setariae TaxID=2801340 RepID=A0A936YN82_9HYPH|nr:nitrate reductase [Rhizobium setariae]MBL0373555.1 molybdopterin-dependent oxidoreductase [Rhizobium setariae]